MAIQRAKANGHIVQPNWTQTDPKKMDYIHNKPEIPVVPATWDWSKIDNKPDITTDEDQDLLVKINTPEGWYGRLHELFSDVTVKGPDENNKSNIATMYDVAVAVTTASTEAYYIAEEVFNSNISSNLSENTVLAKDTGDHLTNIPFTSSNWSSSLPYRNDDGTFEIGDANISFTDGGGYLTFASDAYSQACNNGKGSLPVTVNDISSMLQNFDLNLYEMHMAMYYSSNYVGETGYYGTIPVPVSGSLNGDYSDISFFETNEPYSIPVRNENGQVSVAKLPSDEDHAASKYYVDTNFIKTETDSQTITGSLTVTGDLTIKGTTKTQEAQTQLIEENIIELNAGKTENLTHLSGVVINKDNASAYGIVYDPSSDAVKLGLGETNNGEFSFNSNEGTPIATREEFDNSWEDDAIFVFDKETKKFKYSGKTLASFEEEIMTKMRAEMNIFVKDYIETYMSDIEIEHDDGTTEKISKMIFANDYEEKQNGTELWIKEN